MQKKEIFKLDKIVISPRQTCASIDATLLHRSTQEKNIESEFIVLASLSTMLQNAPKSPIKHQSFINLKRLQKTRKIP
ncbi:hypothetical protein, partial [Escherichia coli]|uniref:hypothetical protein n=1 Tax=Escherichia coli TaxID=562 RepID=UPI001C568AFB